jgi:hypothetical protein
MIAFVWRITFAPLCNSGTADSHFGDSKATSIEAAFAATKIFCAHTSAALTINRGTTARILSQLRQCEWQVVARKFTRLA